MSAKCDDRATAREVTRTPRERELVDEFLNKRLVLVDTSGERDRVGMAGLGWPYWNDLKYRLEDRGFRFRLENPVNRGGRPHLRMYYPGEVVF